MWRYGIESPRFSEGPLSSSWPLTTAGRVHRFFMAAKRGTRFEALSEPIRQGIRERFGGIPAKLVEPWAACVTTTGRTTWPTIFNRGRVLQHRKFPEPRAGARRQRRRGALASAR